MGYDIYASGTATIPADKVLSAGKALVAAIYKEGKEVNPVPPRVETTKQVLALFEKCRRIFIPIKGNDGSIKFESEDSFRNLDDEEWIFEALGPFFDADSGFDFTGEDGAKWLWRFNANGIVVEDGETLYGKDTEAPSILAKVVDIIYPDGKMPTDDLDAVTALDAIRKVITDGGFGPFAGMTAVDMLATVADESKED